jgi:hypothetical protein
VVSLLLKDDFMSALRGMITRLVEEMFSVSTTFGEQRSLLEDAELRANPTDASGTLSHLHTGAVVTVFPQDQVGEGWVIAQNLDGLVGFVRAARLSPAMR